MYIRFTSKTVAIISINRHLTGNITIFQNNTTGGINKKHGNYQNLCSVRWIEETL